MTRVVSKEFAPQAPLAPQPRKPRHYFRWFFLLCLLFIGVTCTIGYFAAPLRFNILLVGSDQRGTERARSDVLLLASIPKTKKDPIVFLTIPRDTKIEDPEYGLQKITHFYAFGERDEDTELGNVNLTQEVLERELDIHIHASAEVTFLSFEKLIDDLGGVAVSSGTLSGEEALSIVRDRYREGGDFARAADQREIVQALAKKIISREKFQEVLSFFQFNPQARIHYSKGQVWHFIGAFVIGHIGHLGLTNTHEEVLPGVGTRIYTPEFGKELYYYELDPEATTQLLDMYIR